MIRILNSAREEVNSAPYSLELGRAFYMYNPPMRSKRNGLFIYMEERYGHSVGQHRTAWPFCDAE